MSTPKELNPNYWPLKETVEIEIADAAKKDAEIARLKGELAEVLSLCRRLVYNDVQAVADLKSMGIMQDLPAITKEISAFLQKHTPPMDRSSGDNFRAESCQPIASVQMGGGQTKDCTASQPESSPPLNCGSAAAGESPSHSGGGDACTLCGGSGIQELPLGCMGTEVCVLCLGTGKSALREVPPTGGVS